MPNRPITKLTLYGDSISGNCLKTKWTAEYLDIDHDWVEISVVEGGTRSDAFMTMNPSGQVPVLRLPDGRILPQSNAIILYLAEIGGGSELIPADPFEKAKMMSWLFWEQYSHEPAVAVVRYKVRYDGLSPSDIDPVLIRKSYAALQHMEDRLHGRTFLVGDALSLADIALVAYTRLAPEGGFDLSAYPAIRSWIATVEKELGL